MPDERVQRPLWAMSASMEGWSPEMAIFADNQVKSWETAAFEYEFFINTGEAPWW